MSQTKKKLAAAVKASGTTLTGVSGVGPVIAATVLAGGPGCLQDPRPGPFRGL